MNNTEETDQVLMGLSLGFQLFLRCTYTPAFPYLYSEQGITPFLNRVLVCPKFKFTGLSYILVTCRLTQLFQLFSLICSRTSWG